jgi:hypothetical protein
MGLIIGIIVVLGSLVAFGLIVYANGMSDSPMTSISPWAITITGLLIGGFLIASHFWHWAW